MGAVIPFAGLFFLVFSLFSVFLKRFLGSVDPLSPFHSQMVSGSPWFATWKEACAFDGFFRFCLSWS